MDLNSLQALPQTGFIPSPDKDCALTPADILYRPGPEFSAAARQWQAIPSIVKTAGGRLIAAFYGGGQDEGPENYIAVIVSDDDGVTWSDERAVLNHPCTVRPHEPILWRDPENQIWLFWNQSYIWWDGRGGLWASILEEPDGALQLSPPRRLFDGVLAVKPLVLADGGWLFPLSVWKYYPSGYNQLPELMNSFVCLSRDRGRTLARLGGVEMGNTTFDENMVIQRADGTLLMLARLADGLASATSTDGGASWSQSGRFPVASPSARFFLQTLRSGRVLLVTHHNFTGRNRMTAMLSDDGGETFPFTLLLDERADVSYPDGYQDEQGNIYIVYDRERYDAKELLLAVFTEEDILAGRCVSVQARLKIVMMSAAGAPIAKGERRGYYHYHG